MSQLDAAEEHELRRQEVEEQQGEQTRVQEELQVAGLAVVGKASGRC